MVDYETAFLVIVIIIAFVIFIVALALSTTENNNIIRSIKHINTKIENYKDFSLMSSNWSNFDAISDISLNNKDITRINKLNFENRGSIFNESINEDTQRITLLSDELFEKSFVNVNGKLSLQNQDNLCYIYSNESGVNFDIKDSKITLVNIDQNYSKIISNKGILSNSFKSFNDITIQAETVYEQELEPNTVNHIDIPNNGSKETIVKLPTTELHNGVVIELFRSPNNIFSDLKVLYKDNIVSVVSGMNSNKMYKYIYSSNLDKWYEVK